MPRPRFSSRAALASGALVGALAFGLSLPALLPAEARVLYLDVSVNGRALDRINRFEERDGGLFASPEDLRGLGLALPEAPAAGLVALDDLSGLSYRYDEPRQALDFSIRHDRLTPAAIALRAPPERVTAESAWGGVLNYDLLGEYQDSKSGGESTRLGAFGELRLFSPYVVASSSGVGNWESAGEHDVTRLESRLTFDDPERALSWRAGDFVSGGLSWTRPVRGGGVQVASDFAMRPDIVTFPTPDLAGMAAAPSTLDIFVNNVRRVSVPVEAGPFTVEGAPIVTGAGEIALVMRDALGRETVTSLPFYASPRLLDPGLAELSVEAGYLREDFGRSSATYGLGFGSSVLRYGLSSNLTFEGHVEAASGLLAGGGGAVATWPGLGLLGAAVAASDSRFGQGGLASLSFERRASPFSLSGETILASAAYADIPRLEGDAIPRQTSRLNLGLSLDEWGSVGLGYARLDYRERPDTEILSGSYSASLPGRIAHLSVSGFGDMARESFGVGASLFVPFGNRRSGSAGLRRGADGGWSGHASYAQAPPAEGGFGYRASVSEGDNPRREAELVHESARVDLRGGVSQTARGVGARLGATGAAAFLDGAVYFADRVHDGFAVVDVGGFPGVEVLRENRPVGRTDESGRIFVNGLRAWEANRLAIEPLDLPFEASVGVTSMAVSPRANSGLLVEFPVESVSAALLTITLPEGGHPPPGSDVTIDGAGTVLGHDGQAYVTRLAAHNHGTVSWAGGRCVISFTVAPTPGRTPNVPVICHAADEGAALARLGARAAFNQDASGISPVTQ